jgi:hypothetical protein
MDQRISVPISAEIVYEMLLRSGPEADISAWIEDIFFNYLDSTSANDGWKMHTMNTLNVKPGIRF